MKLSQAIEGGLAGATTISLLTNTLRKIDDHTMEGNLFDGRNLHKRFKKANSKKPYKAAKQYVGLAGELLSSSAFLGLSSLGKRKHALLRGAILGTVAGLGAEFLRGMEKKKSKVKDDLDVLEGQQKAVPADNELLKKILRVGFYTMGGLVAGKLIQPTGKKRKKK